IRSETDLRQEGNTQIAEVHMGLTVQQWCTHLSDSGLITVPSFSAARPGRKVPLGPKPALKFELYVNFAEYNSRVTRGGMPLSAAETGKCGRSESMAAVSGGPSKFPRVNTGHTVFKSSFSLAPRSIASVSTSTKATFKMITCPHITPQGDPVFSTGETVTAWISESAFAHGSMKAVYEVPADFAVADHNAQIQHEQTRLARGVLFMKAFYKLCRQRGVDTYPNLQFADAFVLQEAGNPSPASGIKGPAPLATPDNAGVDQTTDVMEPGLMWLVEKRHPSQWVQRFSGTLEHTTPHSDQLHLTVYAFQHFVYGFSNNELVFADLQGTPTTVVGRNGDLSKATILFDPMTHTTTQASGVGDHGPDGIQTFVDQHECRELCKALGLSAQYPLHDLEDTADGYQSGDSGPDPGHVGNIDTV
ncbi:hypothetical protein FA15DRAFT_587615, partial [Coprinopsis marcescibilis]